MERKGERGESKREGEEGEKERDRSGEVYGKENIKWQSSGKRAR